MAVRYTPGDYNYSWHNAPRRQFIVNLDGDVEVEVSGGQKRVIRRGEVFFVEDTTGVCVCVSRSLHDSIVHVHTCHDPSQVKVISPGQWGPSHDTPSF